MHLDRRRPVDMEIGDRSILMAESRGGASYFDLKVEMDQMARPDG